MAEYTPRQLEYFVAVARVRQSVLLRGGVDIKRVQEWLGHHSAAFTLDIYGHVMPDDHEASLLLVERLFGWVSGSEAFVEAMASLASPSKAP